MKKNNFVLIFVCFLIIGNLLFVSCEVIKGTDGIQNLFSEDVFFEGSGLNYQPLDGGGANFFAAEDENQLSIETNLIENVNPNIDNFFRVNSEGEFEKADFTIGKDAECIFNGKSYSLVPGTRVLFDQENGWQINIPKNSFFKLPELINSDLNKYKTTFSGENAQIGDVLLNGEMEETKNGFVLTSWEATKNNLRFITTNENEKVLIANEGVDLSGYEGNYVSMNNEKGILNIKSSENGKINFELVGKNEILNSDNKDLLKGSVLGGDELIFENRNSGGFIPNLEYISSEKGKTKIENGNFGFTFENGEIQTLPAKSISLEQIKNERYQTLALEMETGTSEKLLVNSYNQYVFASSNEENLLSFDKYDLPVSNSLEENSIQTVEDLQEKYPDIPFDARGVIPPTSVHVLETFLEKYPERLKIINGFVFFEEGSDAFAGSGKIYLGRGVLDYSSEEGLIVDGNNIREVTSPVQVILHESGHAYQNYMEELEGKYIDENIKSPEILKLRKDLVEVGGRFNEIVDRKFGGSTFVGFFSPDPEIQKVIRDKEALLKELTTTLYNQGYTSLSQEYAQVIEKSWGDFSNNQVVLEYFQKERELLSDKTENVLENIFSKYTNLNPEEYLVQKFDETYSKEALGEEEFYWAVFNYLDSSLDSQGNEFTPDYEKIFPEEKHALFEALYKMNKVSTDLDERFLKYKENSRGKEIFAKEEFKAMSSIQDFYAVLNAIPTFSSQKNQLDQLARTFGGVPYIYVYQDYSGGESTGELLEAKFSELSTTFLEQPVETRKRWMENGLTNVRETYSTLTQLAFDSGEMEVEEYTYLMGDCKRSDCLDKKCVEYKLICCQEYPNSPNC